jgi:antitoxin ParD1/3/4
MRAFRRRIEARRMRDTEDGAKLEVLRQAARVGAAALDRGDFKEIEDIEDLQTYLNDLSEKVIFGAAE